MQFAEMGNQSGKTLMLLPGTACDYQTNFGSVLDRLGEKYRLICVNYDGFDGSGTIFPDLRTVTEKIEGYIQEHFDGRLDGALGSSLGGSFVGQLMKQTAALNAADRNPYSWNMEFLPYPDGSGYEARFSKCGICTLMRELGLFEYVPAMCRLDYTMSEAGGADEFVRQYTLASGGPYCDCGYKKL